MVYDFVLINEKLQKTLNLKKNTDLWISSRRDDVFYLDKIQYEEEFLKNKNDFKEICDHKTFEINVKDQ